MALPNNALARRVVSRDPFRALARTAGRAASIARTQAAPVARRVGAGLANAAAAAKVRTRTVYSGLKEPASAALQRGGVELAGHSLGYAVDRMMPWRAAGGWIRPSFFVGALAFVFSSLTGGKTSRALLNLGAGTVHHYAARSLELIDKALSGPGAPTGTSGADDDNQATY